VTRITQVIDLPSVTLLCVDCVEVRRAIEAVERCKSHCRFGAVKLLTSLSTDYEHAVPIEVLSSVQEYSTFMLRRAVDYVATEHVLVVQHDGYTTNSEAWNPAFLRYDYVGAPWRDGVVGNGGFSLRSRALMARVAERCRAMGGAPAVVVGKDCVTNEDVVICRGLRNRLEREGFSFAPANVALRFSVEDVGDARRAFGGHRLPRAGSGGW